VKVRVVALGHRMPAWVTAAVDDYAKRLPREWALVLTELKPEPRGRGKTVAQVLAAEAPRVVAACTGHRIVALDERGAAWTTRQLAARLAQWNENGDDIAFVIGSADGLAQNVKSQAAALVALSAMTLPHGLARVLLIEQLYRAHSLLAGHPYHRE
jgi:23S rRNA (pseudouridine1915-N3)-methyltransferase